MGWWEDFSNAVSEGADAVADVVQAVVDTAGDAATDLVETVGNGVQQALQTFGGPAGAWLGGVINGITNLVGAVIKLASGIVSGVLGGIIRIAGGLLAWNGELVFKGIMDIITTIAGGIVYVAGTLLSLIQKIFFLQNNERPLTKAEREMLRKIYFNSISLFNIRIVEGWSGAFGSGNFATTLGNTIYLRDIDPNTGGGRSTLVHESLHIWQYQNLGSRYTAEALGAQYLLPRSDDAILAYNWEVSEVNRDNDDWWDFNREAQAEFVQDVWRLGSLTFNGHTNVGQGAFFDLQEVQASFGNGTAEFIYTGSVDSEHATVANSDIPVDYTDLATAAVSSIRNRINIRWSRSF